MLPTALTYAYPRLCIDTDYDWTAFDFQAFNDDFDWTSDPLNGYWDVVQPVEETINTQQGDCDDYAAVAASYLHETTSKPIRFAFLYRDGGVVPDHVAVGTGKRVYESGVVHDQSLVQYQRASPYTSSFTRTVR